MLNFSAMINNQILRTFNKVCDEACTGFDILEELFNLIKYKAPAIAKNLIFA
jgi:hypothetical protein